MDMVVKSTSEKRITDRSSSKQEESPLITSRQKLKMPNKEANIAFCRAKWK